MKTSTATTHIERAPRALVVGALLAVYFIWGSTYLGLRFGLESFPPFLLNGFRFLIAGGILFLVLAVRGRAIATPRQWWNAARMGLVLLVGGVGLVTIAEDVGVGSGIAATAVAVIPVWIALISGLFGDWPHRREWIGLVIGLAGVLVLAQESDFQTSTMGMILLIISPIIWAFGSIWGARLDLPDSSMTTAIELVSAGLVMSIVGPLFGERITEPPTTVAWIALGYLAIMGSLVAFTAYIYLLKTVRPALSTSYAYVNPIVAVALGVTLGRETLTGPVFIALPLILTSVALVATTQHRRSLRASDSPPSLTPIHREDAA
ncbi:MAG TPA: drug/metabolite exporter YedA [Acidimicrobiia bacterium]|nr:drug/metabolite exporter YedA [Acidimicrobiia bacterium]